MAWDFWLQKLKPFIPSYVCDTSHILEELRAIDGLPLPMMHSSINAKDAILVINFCLDDLSHRPSYPTVFPMDATNAATRMITRNEILEFGELNFIQQWEAATGTSVAVISATIYFSFMETKCLLLKFGAHLHNLGLRRFVEDIFDIWISSDCNNGPTACKYRPAFERRLDSFGRLNWKVEEPSKQLARIDLPIKVKCPRITTCTYQKPRSFRLYLSGPSVHPRGSTEGATRGLIRRYLEQNTKCKDYPRAFISALRDKANLGLIARRR